MADFKPIETQEDFDRAISERIQRDRAAMEKKFADYLSPDAFKEKVQGLNDQIAGLTAKLGEANEQNKVDKQTIADKDAQIHKYETASVKSRVAHEVGLPFESVDFIQGDDEETIRKSAEVLVGIVGKSSEMPMASNDTPPKNGNTAALKGMLSELKL